MEQQRKEREPPGPSKHSQEGHVVADILENRKTGAQYRRCEALGEVRLVCFSWRELGQRLNASVLFFEPKLGRIRYVLRGRESRDGRTVCCEMCSKEIDQEPEAKVQGSCVRQLGTNQELGFTKIGISRTSSALVGNSNTTGS